MPDTPQSLGFRMPAEWTRHRATWLAWPSDEGLWLDDLQPARAAVVELARALADGEAVEVLVPDEEREQQARAALADVPVSLRRAPFGDIWLRDTGPIFVVDGDGRRAACRFAWNGWGGKYLFDDDVTVGDAIAGAAGGRVFRFPWVLEGGAIDVDGEGTALTTVQCLLNPNRNPGMDGDALEGALRDALGIERCLWLDRGLANDHTDGHVDTLARFVRPGVVVCMEPEDDDPNRAALMEVLSDLSQFTDARGRRLQVATVPSPGRVEDASGRVMPASYVNFYIGNRAVVVPTYGVPADADAVAGVAALFPDRRTVGVDARAVLAGGGAFHCITQQEPEGQP